MRKALFVRVVVGSCVGAMSRVDVVVSCFVFACVHVVGAYIISRGASVGDGVRLGWDYGR